MRRCLGTWVPVLAASVAAFCASSSAAAGKAARKVGFSVPTVVDPIHPYGEPTISFDTPRNEVFASGPTGTGTQRSIWEGSVDGGRSFRIISPGNVPNAFTGEVDPPGGGDTDMNFDRSGKEYFIDLYALICDRAATTSNGGATAQQGFLGCAQSPGTDRPWLAVYDPAPGTPHRSAYSGPKPLIYDEYNNLNGPGPNSGGQWNKSTDGLTWTNATNGVTPLTEAIYSPFGPDGYPAIDQVTGKVFQAAGFPVGFPNNSSNSPYDLLLNIGTPDAQGNLTFLDAPSTMGGGPNFGKLIHVANNLPGSPDTLFSVVSMDSARNLFVVWAVNKTSKPGDDQIFVAGSSAASGWRKWTAPVQVSNGSTSTGDAVNVFPWVKAGGPGRIDAVWYGSNKKVDPSSQSGQAWNVLMSQAVFPVKSGGAITGARPSKTLVKVSPHPMHYNDICLQGSGCISSQGNRNLADFFTVTIDRTGAAEIIYNDTSNGLVQPGFTPGNLQLVDHAGAALVTIARQASGMGLFGKRVSGTSHKPVRGIGDPAGDAKHPVIGGSNVAGMDIRASALAFSSKAHTLTVTMKVVNLNEAGTAAATIPGTQLLQYVTRWQKGKTLYYAAMSTSSSGQRTFYVGKTQSVDLCSVSACDPHVLTYPESGSGGTSVPGTVSCPPRPSAAKPCTLTLKVPASDIGKPTASSLLEEVGAYAFAASHPQGQTTNAQALLDNVPLEVDGACCYNFRASAVQAAAHKHKHKHKRRHHAARKHRRRHRRSPPPFTG